MSFKKDFIEWGGGRWSRASGEGEIVTSLDQRYTVGLSWCYKSDGSNAGRGWWEVRSGPEGGVIEPSGGWRWALPESRPSPGRCHKSPDICPVALPPAEWDQREKERLYPSTHGSPSSHSRRRLGHPVENEQFKLILYSFSVCLHLRILYCENLAIRIMMHNDARWYIVS